jgi:hypothetical protein
MRLPQALGRCPKCGITIVINDQKVIPRHKKGDYAWAMTQCEGEGAVVKQIEEKRRARHEA